MIPLPIPPPRMMLGMSKEGKLALKLMTTAPKNEHEAQHARKEDHHHLHHNARVTGPSCPERQCGERLQPYEERGAYRSCRLYRSSDPGCQNGRQREDLALPRRHLSVDRAGLHPGAAVSRGHGEVDRELFEGHRA